MTDLDSRKYRMDLSPRDGLFNKVLFTTDCWEWQGHKNKGGYGQIFVDGKLKLVHRFSYELHKGVIPQGLQLDHLCRVRHCVNPDHLEPVTNQENQNRGFSGHHNNSFNRDKTHCKRGHEFTPDNTHHRKNGKRLCKGCNRNLRQKSRGKIIVGY